MLAIECDDRAGREPRQIGREVIGAGRPDRPVHEIRARILGVRIAVEKVADGETPDRPRDAVDVALPSELKRAVRNLFLLAAEAECLAEEIALRAELRKLRATLLRFTIRKASQPERSVQAESLGQFRIEVELAALPHPPSENRFRR